MYLKGVEEMRDVQWGRTYLWDIRFIGGGVPDPFSNWFPATTVEEPDGNINSFGFEGGAHSYKIPQNKNASEIRLTFVDRDFEADDKKYNLYEWMKAWRGQVIQDDGTVGTLSEISKHILIAKLNTKREVVRVSGYWVYPEGDLTFAGNSESGIPTYNVNLVIVARD